MSEITPESKQTLTAAESIMATVRDLCRFQRRAPGSNGERGAASDLAAKLRADGRKVEIEPIRVRPYYALTHALTLAVVVVGTVISVKLSAPLGVLILLIAALSMYGDLTTRFYLIRRLTPARASQNVVSINRNSDRPARLILTAHYDAAPTGLTFRDSSARLLAAIHRKLKISIGPFTIVFWSVMAELILSVLRLAGLETTAVAAVQFGFAVILVITFALMIDIALSETVPGANDNATGVGTALELLRKFKREPLRNLSLDVILVGAEEGNMLGTQEWIRKHAHEYPADSTYFLNIDTLGYGNPRFLTREGFIFFFDYSHGLIQLCQQVAELNPELGARPYKNRLGTDGLVPLLAGFPTASIIGLDDRDFLPNYHQPNDTPENIDPAALERCYNFCSSLIKQLDGQLDGSAASSEPITPVASTPAQP